MIMQNIPEVKLGIIAVSRDCFPKALAERRRTALVKEFGIGLYECLITVENETDALRAIEDIETAGVNALVVYLGNFGPETPETLLAERFHGPVMYCAAAEGDGDLFDGRGDAYCGMLNCSYNLKLRRVRAHIPEYPVGMPAEIVGMIRDFIPIARTILGIRDLKVITFGPRPSDFLACNAPIKPLYDLKIAVEENSELDLLVSFGKHKDDKRIPDLVAEMAGELGENRYSGILPKLAQFELTLIDWAAEHMGASRYVVFANKCWPAFQTEFGFVPCYVNSRLTGRGIPVACEVDIYGALSEYIGICASGNEVTLLDVNNTVPDSIYSDVIKQMYEYRKAELFMGFHCGNTCASRLRVPKMGYQLIMKRALEPGSPEPDITRGTLEGSILPGNISLFRLQGAADTSLTVYIAEGEVLDVEAESFGGIGIFAIPEMDRFYRHVLIEKAFPHHTVVVFSHSGKALFETMKYLGIEDISYNQPAGRLYKTENPFV